MTDADFPRPPARSSATGPRPASTPGADPIGAGDRATVVRGSGSKGQGAESGGEAKHARLPAVGERLDSFLLLESIGAGGMGAVFRAHDEQLDRTVAIKVLPPEQAGELESVGRFYQEGRAAARLDHENIARVFTIGRSGSTHYIAFEFIEGTTLRQRVDAAGVLAVGDAIHYTLQIATAFVHAAERGVVHRDVKPSNIVVTPQGRAKLVDMGLARSFERGGDVGLTQTGMTLGTFDYISPEQARDPRDVDVRSDLYSLGCTLFYMLAGRPPFPDGTVLQKLLQHQEETPPDVRTFNPAVPADLAEILVKLMAKDRDRRYQTPEQLVRDLLSVAGAHDLHASVPAGLAWPEAPPAGPTPAAWERHLVWGVPALAFLLIIGFFVFGGPGLEPTPPTTFPPDVAGSSPRDGKSAATSKPDLGTTKAPPTRPVAAASPAVAAAPGVIAVRRSDDLTRLLADAPRGAAIELVESGVYEVRASAAPLTLRDVTIRAAAGASPVLRLAADERARTAAAVLDFKAGRVAIFGLGFEIDGDDRETSLAAVRTEDVDLKLTRCTVRRVGSIAGKVRTVALEIRETEADDLWKGPAEVVVDSSYLEGCRVGVLAEGPVDVALRDVAVASMRDATIGSVNRSPSRLAGSIRIVHASVLLGGGPFLRSSGVSPRVVVNGSVISASNGGSGADSVLVVADDPARLDWQGRDNLFDRIGVYLQAEPSSAVVFAAVKSFEAWADAVAGGDDAASLREAGSTSSKSRVWAESDPVLASATHPATAFRLAPTWDAVGRFGARRTPAGPAARRAVEVAADPIKPVDRDRKLELPDRFTPAASPLVGSAAAVPRVDAARPSAPVAPPPTEVATNPAAGAAGNPPPMNVMDFPPDDMPPEMATMPTVPGAGEAVPAAAAAVAAKPGEPPRVEPTGAPARPDAPAAPASRSVSSAAQLIAALAEGGGPETILIAAGADIDVSTCRLSLGGTRSIVAVAEAGKTRPRLTFRPRPGDVKPGEAWTAWITVLAGSLHLEGLDVVLRRDDAPRIGGWGPFSVGPGADVSLENCTVTIEGSTRPSAIFVAGAGTAAEWPAVGEGFGFGEPPPSSPTTTIRLRNTLIRTSGDVLEVAGDRRVDFQVENAAIAAAGAMIRSAGRPRGLAAEPIKATLRRLAARVEGGLLRLESTAADPELATVEIVARDVIVSTDGKTAPMIQVDGQDDFDALRDRVRWDARGVAFHRISTYRRDQVLKPGEFPKDYDRATWERSLGRRDRDATFVHGDAGYVAEWPADRPAWSAQGGQFRLRPDAAAAGEIGPDLALIPDAPAAR